MYPCSKGQNCSAAYLGNGQQLLPGISLDGSCVKSGVWESMCLCYRSAQLQQQFAEAHHTS